MAYQKNIISTPNAPAAVGTYSQGVEHAGVIYFSGQIGLDPETMVLPVDFETQLKNVMSNIDALLKSQGIDRTHIIKTSIFLKDLQNFSKVNEAYLSFFSDPFPARSCIEASKLPKDALVEIEVIAVK